MYRSLIAVALLLSHTAIAAERLDAGDGRTILLKDDGTWTYESSDRILSTDDGREVRLREDGSWEFTGQMVEPAPAMQGLVANSGELRLELEELAIETARSAVHKGSRKKTNTVFTVSLALAESAEGPQDIAINSAGLMVEDSSGREYPILAVVPAQGRLAPGEELVFQVRADGSPHWFTTKAMELHISEQALPIADELVLKGLMSDARKRDVDEL